MKRLLTSGIALIVSFTPVVALAANVTGSPTVNANQALNLDTGATAASGGDILFTGTSIQFQSSAKGAVLPGQTGSSTFNSLTGLGSSAFSSFSSLFSNAAITPTANAIIAYQTNGGNLGALLVNSVSATSLSLQFVTFASAVPAGPTISKILNNYSLIPGGFKNTGVAQGALFIIKGSGLADPNGTTALQSSAAPGLQTTLNGAKVNVTSGGTTYNPAFYYASPTQLDLVMPSNVPTGSATVTVIYNGQTSNSVSVKVLATGMGFATYYGNGTGLGIASNPVTYAIYNYSNSIPPGATVVLWGSGLGADSLRDTTANFDTSTFNKISGLSDIYFGGVKGTIQYQGPSGFPGVNQINVTVPANAPTGCFVSVVGTINNGNNTTTNSMTLPIGNGPCSDTTLGFNGSTLSSLSGQTTVKTGFVGLDYSVTDNNQPQTLGFAAFQKYTGSAYGTGASNVSLGGCIISESDSASSATGTTTPLNAGTITITSPTATSPVTLTANPAVAGFLFAQLPSGFLTSSGGTFSINATAGTDVGAFTTQVVFPSPFFTWTGQSALTSVTEANGLTVNWSGGSAGTYVLISGASSSSGAFGGFSCIAPVAAGTFTIPPYVLSSLPTGTGTLSLANYTSPQSFTATGLDYGFTYGFTTYTNDTVTYQ